MQRSPVRSCPIPWKQRSREARLEERDLIARVLAGDPSAERAFYDAHVDRIYRLVYRMAGDPDLAEELTQEAFVRAFDRLSSYRGEAALSSWLHRVAVSVTLNRLKKLKRHRAHEVSWEGDLPALDRDGPERIELQRRLRGAIDRLPEILRVVFVMHDIEGYKHREIAAALDVPENTSKARLSRARQALRVSLGFADGTSSVRGET